MVGRSRRKPLGGTVLDHGQRPVALDTCATNQPPADYAAIAARYRLRHPEVPVIKNLDAKILEAITTGKGSLDMSTWHTCKTTHCRAGWAITLAGEKGHELEEKYASERAGVMIYRASTGRVPNFFATTETAMEDIRACAGADKE